MDSRTPEVRPARRRPRASCKEYALWLLGARPYSERDLRRRLERRGYERDEVATAVAELKRSGLVDDAKFAAQFARSKLLNDSASPRRVSQLLSRKGILREVAEEAIASVVEVEEVDSRAAAERLAHKKVASLQGLEPTVVRRRLFGFLARRGFDLDVIRSAVDGVLR